MIYTTFRHSAKQPSFGHVAKISLSVAIFEKIERGVFLLATYADRAGAVPGGAVMVLLAGLHEALKRRLEGAR